jgi:hypothetical protein
MIRAMMSALITGFLCGKAFAQVGAIPSNLDPGEELLAVANCSPADVPSSWKKVGEWTFPGNFAGRATLRAYHARSFGSGQMNVDYMVCHLLWYGPQGDIGSAFKAEIGQPANTSCSNGTIGERLCIGSSGPSSSGPYVPQYSYRIVLQRAPFLFQAGGSTTIEWPIGRLEALARAIDARLLDAANSQNFTEDHGRLLKDRLRDPGMAPRCIRTCRLHHTAFTPTLVRVAYGLPGGGPEDADAANLRALYAQAKAAGFPEAAPSRIQGGCIVDDLIDSEWICSCPVCSAEDARWREAHVYRLR